jgi:hypothetical protein
VWQQNRYLQTTTVSKYLKVANEIKDTQEVGIQQENKVLIDHKENKEMKRNTAVTSGGSMKQLVKMKELTGNFTRDREVIKMALISIINLLSGQRKLPLLVFLRIDMLRFDISRSQSKPQLALGCHSVLEGSGQYLRKQGRYKQQTS